MQHNCLYDPLLKAYQSIKAARGERWENVAGPTRTSTEQSEEVLFAFIWLCEGSPVAGGDGKTAIIE